MQITFDLELGNFFFSFFLNTKLKQYKYEKVAGTILIL